MHRLNSRACRWVAIAAVALAAAGLHSAQAADATPWPTKAVHVIVGFPAGSSPDTLARLVGEPLAKELGQPVVIENRPGAGGNIGVDAVVHATDGNTFGFTTNGPLTTARQLIANLPYDPAKDIKPLSFSGSSPLVLVCDIDLPVKTLKDFIQYAKTQKQAVTYGSVGIGSGSHLTTELFANEAGITMLHVPFQGFPQVTNAILGHQIQSAFMAPSGALVQAKAGKLRLLAVSSPQRSALMPDVPTVAEAALPGFQADLWIGAFGPASMPADVAHKLTTAINAALQLPEVKEKLLIQGWQAVGAGPNVLSRRITDDTALWGGVIQRAHLSPE